ncbi:MAG: hypothetical protein IPN59_13640 [Holophaga sp.]|nr:hypothetical protein [Holophaga sp.]
MNQEPFIISPKSMLNIKTKPLMDSVDMLARIRRLDMTALAAVHERYYPDVYRFTAFRLSDQHTAEDIASEVFMRLLEALKRGAGRKKLRSGFGHCQQYDPITCARCMPPGSRAGNDRITAGESHPAQTFEQAWQSSELKSALKQLTPSLKCSHPAVRRRVFGRKPPIPDEKIGQRSKSFAISCNRCLRRLLEGKSVDMNTSDVNSQIFEDCLTLLEQGETLDEILQRYPQQAAELRPMLAAAGQLHQELTAIPVPAAAQNLSRAKFMKAASIAQADQRSSKAKWLFWLPWISFRQVRLSPYMRATVMLFLIFSFIGAFGAVRVSARAIPGDVLYPVKRAAEQTQLLLAQGQDQKLRLEKSFDEETPE